MEAVKILMPRIQKLDPVNASSIMCNILMQAGGENEIIRLAFVPESFLLSYINKVKTSMGIISLDVPFSKPPSPPIGANTNSPYPQGIMIPNNGFHLSNPPNFSTKPISYADVLSGSSSSNLSGSPGLGMGLPFFGGGDELLSGQDQLEETMRDPIVSPGGRSDSIVFPYGEDVNAVAIHSPQSYPFHKRSFSVNDAAFLSNFEEGGGFGWRPCVYYARGYCKNGSSCKFVHSDLGVGDSQVEIGSPSRADSGFDEMLRFKALHQQQQHQKFSLMASGGHHPLQYNKWMNFLTGNQRNDFSPVFRPGENSSLRQIYLTFPADSTFKEDDVFRYFSKFGPVHDVRIPYQQKRMFGFVTFFLPETVKMILAKGNPHFVCDSRVLVKPYKEKGKVAEKKQQQHQQHQYLDRGEFSACLSPSGIDSNELGDLPIGPRMLQNTQEMMRRKKMEQEMELQHAIELQGQRMMNLQIMDRGNQQLDNRFLPNMLGGSVPVHSPLQSQLLTSQKTTFQDVLQEFDNGQEAADHHFFLENGSRSAFDHQCLNYLDSYSSDSNLEHALPENLFASPTKSAAEHKSIFSHTSAGDIIPFSSTSSNNADVVPSSSSLASASSQTTSH